MSTRVVRRVLLGFGVGAIGGWMVGLLRRRWPDRSPILQRPADPLPVASTFVADDGGNGLPQAQVSGPAVVAVEVVAPESPSLAAVPRTDPAAAVQAGRNRARERLAQGARSARSALLPEQVEREGATRGADTDEGTAL